MKVKFFYKKEYLTLKPKSLLDKNSIEFQIGSVNRDIIYLKSLKIYNKIRKNFFLINDSSLSNKKDFDIKYGSYIIVFIQILIDRIFLIEKYIKTKNPKIKINNFNYSLKRSISGKVFFKDIVEEKWNEELIFIIIYLSKRFSKYLDFNKELISNKRSSKAYSSLRYISSDDFFKKLLYRMKKFIALIYGYNKKNNFKYLINEKIDKNENLILYIILKFIPKYSKNGIVYSSFESSVSFWNDDFFKSSIVKSRKIIKKINIKTYQHGGNIGTAKINTFEWYQNLISDEFYTWGTPNSPKQTQKGISNNHFKNNNNISNEKYPFYVVYNSLTPRYGYYIHGFPHASENINYLEFIKNSLESFNRNKIKIRNYPEDYGWNQDEYWKNYNFKTCNKSYYYHLKRSELNIVTYNATVLLESIQLNRPTIALFSSHFMEFNKSKKIFYLDLEKVGVLHSSSKSLKSWYIKNKNNINGWWESKKVKDSIDKFKKNVIG